MEQDKTNVITNHVEIDERLLAIATIDKQIEDYEQLKKHRVASIQKEINYLEDKKAEHRESIKNFMRDHGEKSLNYPGVAKVSRRLGKGKWIIKDEDALIKYLYEKLDPSILETVVVATPKIVKKSLDPVLTDLAQNNALDTDSVEFESAPDSLTITFDKSEGLQQQIKDLREIALPEEGNTQKYERDVPSVAKVVQRPTSSFDALEF